jgi:hypothetical protein
MDRGVHLPTSPSPFHFNQAHTFFGGVDTAWVRQYASGLVPAIDIATAIVTDVSGNVHVTGVSYHTLNGFDYATIKYNSAGAEQWVARYSGPGIATDSATAIALDHAGNIYVTGKSWGAGTSFDYATIKYNPLGKEQWVARYTGPGSLNDSATDIIIDGSGYVYATGSSLKSNASVEIVTIKYNSSGAEVWIAHYQDQRSHNAKPADISVDGSGNVYVTGWSEGPEPDRDYVTIKYNTAGVHAND